MATIETESFLAVLSGYLKKEAAKINAFKANPEISMNISHSPLYHCDISVNDVPCPAYLSKIYTPVKVKKQEGNSDEGKKKVSKIQEKSNGKLINKENMKATKIIKQNHIKDIACKNKKKEVLQKGVRRPLCSIQQTSYGERKKFKSF